MIDETLPKIVVGEVKENEDGSAEVELHLEPPAVQLILDIGFNQLLKEHLENIKDE
jgi:hypothetical protein